jgi:hypothetical protein
MSPKTVDEYNAIRGQSKRCLKGVGAGVLLQSGLVVASALATREQCKAVAVDPDHLLFTL